MNVGPQDLNLHKDESHICLITHVYPQCLDMVLRHSKRPTNVCKMTELLKREAFSKSAVSTPGQASFTSQSYFFIRAPTPWLTRQTAIQVSDTNPGLCHVGLVPVLSFPAYMETQCQISEQHRSEQRVLLSTVQWCSVW